jgi:hypothetical protein
MTQSLRFLRYNIIDGIAEILMDNGPVNALDLAQVRRLFATRPGPSAWVR